MNRKYKGERGLVMQNPLEFADRAHYLGSLPKGDHMCDFYEIVVDGQVSYIYIRIDTEARPDPNRG